MVMEKLTPLENLKKKDFGKTVSSVFKKIIIQ